MSLKNQWIKEKEGKYGFVNSKVNKFVCSQCFKNLGIREFIEDHPQKKKGKCDFCHKENTILKISYVAKHIFNCISRKWVHGNSLKERKIYEASETLVYPDKKGDDIRIVLADCSFKKLDSGDLFKDLLSFFSGNWYKIEKVLQDSSIALLPEMPMPITHWEKFKDLILKKRRFFFKKYAEQEGSFDERDVLSYINKYIDLIDLTDTISKGTLLYRARVFDKDEEFNLKEGEFRCPRYEHVVKSSSRMSPDGIPILYLSFDPETAGKAIFKDFDRHLVIVKFKLKKPLKIVDFTKIGFFLPGPDFFVTDKERFKRRNAIRFLEPFLEDISKPIEKDDKKHLEYIPSQVVSEFIKTEREELGIVYKSIKNPNRRNIAIFTDELGSEADWLEFQGAYRYAHLLEIKRK